MIVYESGSGWLYNPPNPAVKGYAGGDCGKAPQGKNNPDMESLHNVGPLPRGLYTLGTPIEGSHLGPFAIPLIPDPANEMYGRSGFFCHGDSIESPGNASNGCIIMPRAVREQMWASIDHTLRVVGINGEDVS